MREDQIEDYIAELNMIEQLENMRIPDNDSYTTHDFNES